MIIIIIIKPEMWIPDPIGIMEDLLYSSLIFLIRYLRLKVTKK